MDPKDKYTDPAQADNDKWLRGVCASDAKLIEPELQAIIEQCAQIADKALAKHLALEGVPHDRCWMGCETLKSVAAAIRHIAQQDSANEGE